MPALHYWISGAAIFVAGGFLLTAIVSFFGIAEYMKRRPVIAITAYVATLLLFAVGWWQAAKQGADADKTETILGQVRDDEHSLIGQNKTLLSSNDRMAKAIGGLANDVSGLSKQMKQFVDSAVALSHSTARPNKTSRPTEPPLPKLAHVKFVVRPIPSTDAKTPYEAQVIIQTDVTITNPHFELVCDGAITDGDFFVTGQGVMFSVVKGMPADRKSFVFSFSFPPFTPDNPIVVTLKSETPINVLGIRDLRGQ